MPRKEGKIVKRFRWNGQRLSVSGDTEKEAAVNKALKIAALEAGTQEVTCSTLVRDWIDEWLETYKHHDGVNSAWYSDIKSYCRKYIIPAIGTVRIRMIKPIQLQKIINANSKSKSFNDKLFHIICQVFRTAYQNGLIAKDPTEMLAPSKSGTEKARRSLTEYEREVLLEVLEGHRGKLFCYLMLYAGLRPGEAAALLWKDVDLSNRTISINKALKSDSTIQPRPKTAAGFRAIPISDALFNALDDAKGSPFSLVCVNSLGNGYTRRTIYDMWKNIKRLMDIRMGASMYRNTIQTHALADDLVMYDLRHTFCTDLQSAGVPINVAKELMGHESIDVTSKIYTHHSDVSISDALSKMNKFQKSDKLEKKSV